MFTDLNIKIKCTYLELISNNPMDALTQLKYSRYSDSGYEVSVVDSTGTIFKKLMNGKHVYFWITSFDPIGIKTVKLLEFLAKTTAA